MIKEGKFGVHEAVCLVVIAISNRVFFTAPTVVSKFVGTAGWYMSLISNATTIVFFTFIYFLMKRFPKKNIYEIYNISFGRFIGFIFSLVYAVSFTAAVAILLREFVEVLKVFIFPQTPISILIGTFLTILIVAVFLGLESIARVATLAGYPLLIGFILLLLLSAQNFKTTNLFPFFGYGLNKTILEGVTRSSAYSEVIVLTVFAGSLQGVEHIKKAGYIALILSGLIVSTGILCMSLVFPYYTMQELIAPLYIMARTINYGVFFQRLDPIFLFLYIMSTIIASSIVFYSAVSSYCISFRLQDWRPIIIPLAVVVFAISMIPKDLTEVIDKYIEALRIFPIFTFYFLPLLALIVCALRKKGGENTNA